MKEELTDFNVDYYWNKSVDYHRKKYFLGSYLLTQLFCSGRKIGNYALTLWLKDNGETDNEIKEDMKICGL